MSLKSGWCFTVVSTSDLPAFQVAAATCSWAEKVFLAASSNIRQLNYVSSVELNSVSSEGAVKFWVQWNCTSLRLWPYTTAGNQHGQKSHNLHLVSSICHITSKPTWLAFRGQVSLLTRPLPVLDVWFKSLWDSRVATCRTRSLSCLDPCRIAGRIEVWWACRVCQQTSVDSEPSASGLARVDKISHNNWYALAAVISSLPFFFLLWPLAEWLQHLWQIVFYLWHPASGLH